MKSLRTSSVQKGENNAYPITQEEQMSDVSLIKYLKHVRMSKDDSECDQRERVMV